MASHALEVDHLTKTFKLHKEKTNSLKQLIASRGRRNVYEEFVALDDVSLHGRARARCSASSGTTARASPRC